MDRFTVALIQHRAVERDAQRNAELAEGFMRQAADAGADFVLFPECFLTSYWFPEPCYRLPPLETLRPRGDFQAWCEAALSPGHPAIERVRAAARACNVGVEVGALMRGRELPRNAALAFGRDGELLSDYTKVHTCDFAWERYLEPGEAFKTFLFDGIRIGTMICYDREYPESGRELMLQGAEIALCPNHCFGMRPRLMELAVCAMQNRMGVAMANIPGDNAGRSCAFHPCVWDDDGRGADTALVLADETFDGMVLATFDLAALRAWRAAEDIGRYRKPSAYPLQRR